MPKNDKIKNLINGTLPAYYFAALVQILGSKHHLGPSYFYFSDFSEIAFEIWLNYLIRINFCAEAQFGRNCAKIAPKKWSTTPLYHLKISKGGGTLTN